MTEEEKVLPSIFDDLIWFDLAHAKPILNIIFDKQVKRVFLLLEGIWTNVPFYMNSLLLLIMFPMYIFWQEIDFFLSQCYIFI